jgi:hypothetical protein
MTAKQEARQELVAARETLDRAVKNHPTPDLKAGLVTLDRAIQAMCPHDETTWNSRADGHGGIITTCDGCDVSWHQYPG